MENNIQRNGGDETPKDRPVPPVPTVIAPTTTSTPTPIPSMTINKNGNGQIQNAATSRKEKRLNSMRFIVSKNRELTPLPRMNGKKITLHRIHISPRKIHFSMSMCHILMLYFLFSFNRPFLQKFHRPNVKIYSFKNSDSVVFYSIFMSH